ncbi:MAG TPA: rod shape-determining protein MreC [Clostridiales bacterium]|nr:rod shape-determining protein MreC [Clostridiales bacterium]
MKRFFQENGFLLVVAAVLLAAVLALGNAILGGNPLGNVLEVAFTPFRTVSSAITSWVEDQYNRAFRFDQLQAELEETRKQLAEAQEEARAGQDALREVERLQNLLGLAEARPEFQYEEAMVIRRSVSNWESNLTLDRGSADGVALHNCVVDEYGNLVGVVSEVGDNWALVDTVLSPEVEIGGRIARTDDNAILEGDFTLMLQGMLKLSFLPADTQLVSGDQVVTSGLGGLYPQGLLVGSIRTLHTEEDGLSRYAEIQPAADVDNVRYVYVITDFGGE